MANARPPPSVLAADSSRRLPPPTGRAPAAPCLRSEVSIYIQVPPGVRAKQLEVAIQARHLRVGIQGLPSYLDVRACVRKGAGKPLRCASPAACATPSCLPASKASHGPATPGGCPGNGVPFAVSPCCCRSRWAAPSSPPIPAGRWRTAPSTSCLQRQRKARPGPAQSQVGSAAWLRQLGIQRRRERRRERRAEFTHGAGTRRQPAFSAFVRLCVFCSST